MPSSVLIVGASGRTGQEVMKQLLVHSSKPQVHLFCRDPAKISPDHTKACTSIQQGDARESADLARALTKSQATHVVVSIGVPSPSVKTDVRTASAQALVRAIQTTPGLENVQIVVISSVGAGPTRIKIGMGIGKLLEYYIRYPLADHTGQEAAFLESGLADRTWIVRATTLENGEATGAVVTFGDKEKSLTAAINRSDVAMYLVQAICDGDGNVGGRIDNITSSKKAKPVKQ